MKKKKKKLSAKRARESLTLLAEKSDMLCRMLSDKQQYLKIPYYAGLGVESAKRAFAAVGSTARKTGWPWLRAAADMLRAKRSLRIGFHAYDKYDVALIPQQERREKLKALKPAIRRDKAEHRLRNMCVLRTMIGNSLGFSAAAAEVEDTLRTLGITYQQYNSLNLNRYEAADKEWAMRMLTEHAQQKKAQREKDIADVVRQTGMKRRDIQALYARYSREYGAHWNEFFAYRLYEQDEALISRMFFMGYMKRIMKKYNTDKIITRISVSKAATNRLLKKYIRRKWCVNRGISLEEFRTLFAGEPGVVYKPDYGLQARGVEVLYFNGDVESVYREVMSRSKGVVEEIIKQHPDMNRLSPESVNCLRIVTISSARRPVLADGSRKDVAYVSLKIGRNGHIADNVIAGGMVANVDLKTGVVITDGVNHALEPVTHHPDTGTPIKGFEVPCFKEALDLVFTVIDELKLSGTIGWDIAIGVNGPQIVEPNFGPAASLLQDPYWPQRIGMKDRMARYLFNE